MADVCKICSNLRFQSLRPRRQLKTLVFAQDWFHSDYVSLSDLKTSGGQGCATCKFVLQVIAHYELQFDAEETFWILTYRSGGTILHITNHEIQLYTPEGRPDAWEGITKGPELSEYAHSERANLFIRSCLDRCLRHHPKCVQSQGNPPSRLIDVGPSHDDYVRLMETVTKSHSDYIALSYCWGDVGVVKTTAGNYEEMKTGMPISILPRTIQDAISVTRQLGQRYLWVDALCIIQDSKIDWEIESAKMASIYQSSLLTLAATTAAAASDGFLNQEHKIVTTKSPFQLPWHDEHGNETILAARIVPYVETHTADANDDDDLPLFLRGWTLQEQLLSTRIISYRRHELWWSCLTEPSCECRIINELPEDAKKASFNSIYSITTAEEMYTKWHNTVGEYTLRALKYSSDRLPAIAGVASVVQDLTGSAYIAGLWKDNLVHDLTWEAVMHDVGAQSWISASPDFLGPTFSWVSVGTPVIYGSVHPWVQATGCHIVAAESQAAGLNSLGHVKSAYLTISAPFLKSAHLLQSQSRQDPDDFLGEYLISCGSNKLRLCLDMPLETFEISKPDGITETSIRRSHIPKTRAKVGTPISLLFLGHFINFTHPRTKHLHIYRVYLVLGVCAADITRYERIGIAKQDCVIHRDSSEIPPLCDDFSVSIITVV
ncbi:HET-domain-containing protein [Xylaria palmicola]|nr:HET-domain-containing protein [Xylaria palmicola]